MGVEVGTKPCGFVGLQLDPSHADTPVNGKLLAVPGEGQT
jgi:hypothetical protein